MKDLTLTYVLWFFLGIPGAHKFYLGKIGMGFLYMFTFGGFGIGWLIDFFTIPKQVRDANILLAHKGFHYTPQYTNKNTPKQMTNQEKEKLILLTAKQYQGKITPMEIACETDLSIKDAEDILKKMTEKGYADVQVTQSGNLFYEFSGFLTEDEKKSKESMF